MSSVRVKICGITRREDLRVAVEAGADAVGFVFAERSKRWLDAGQAEKLVRQVPAFVSRVGLFMDQEADHVVRVLDRVPLTLLQFHGSESADFCRQFGLPYMKAVTMDRDRAVSEAAADYPDAAALLLDSHSAGGLGGTGRTFDWSLATAAPVPLVLAGGLTPENVRRAIEQVRPWGVDVSSGVEDEPGVKNPDRMRQFIKEAKREY